MPSDTTTVPREYEPLSATDKRLLLELVRRALERYLTDRSLPEMPAASAALCETRATFVTLRRRDTGELRGCRGESEARQSLVESVVHTATASATDDPRFPPLARDELSDIQIEISALTPMRLTTPEAVIVGQHGLVLRLGPHAGLLLPQVPRSFGWNREEYLDALCRKAGLPAGAWRNPDSRLYAFEAEVWSEEE
jgi:AmmeMemoRadiSam system protein A